MSFNTFALRFKPKAIYVRFAFESKIALLRHCAPSQQAYSQLEGESHVVNTAWAMMALLAAGYHSIDPKPLHKGAAFLMRAQQQSGDWPQQHISGVFNRNCMITYANYR
jgi:squalene cyclase